MLSNKTKRCLSFLVAMIMLISLMPASVLAADEEIHEGVEQAADNTNESIVTESTAAPNPAIAEFQERINIIFENYFGGTDATVEEVRAVVDAMDDETFLNWCYIDMLMLEEDLVWAYEDGTLSESDVNYLLSANPVMPAAAEYVYEKAAQMESDATVYTKVSVLDGKVSLSDNQNTGSGDATKYTATAKGSMFSKKTNTVTITNESGSAATLAFNYSIDKASSYNVNGNTTSTSGSVSVLLAAGDSITVSVTSNSGFSNLTVTLTLTNITLTEAAASSNITFEYNTLGSITVGGEAVASGSVVEIPMTGTEVVATPGSGVKFLGWVNKATHDCLSTATTYTLAPGNDMTVVAVFASAASDAWFLVNGSKLYDDLNAAAAAAGSGGKVVPAYDGTLPKGNYTIPSGVTLLIPYDDGNTLCTTAPTSDTSFNSNGAYATPTVYRKLILANGANITVNGAISLSAKVHAAGGGKTNAGSPTGPCSFMQMDSGSSITVNNGGKLYAWGFITGQGTVTAKSGANIYECFQFMDFRGGTQTTDGDMKTHEVFPLSQYYVQNIEAPLTIEAGASLTTYTNVYMSKMSINFSVPFIGGSDAMFSLTSGSVTKKYDTAKDRLVIEGSGEFSCSSVKLSVSGTTINSADYILPLAQNITLYIKDASKATIAQDLCLMPGAEIVIEQNATVTMGSGIRVYTYDADQWDGYVYSGSANVKLVPLGYAPGRTYTRTAADLKDAKVVVNGVLDASAGYLYTTAGGANICSDGTGVVKMNSVADSVTYQLKQSGATYDEIAVTSAKLKNADGSYTSTTAATYNYVDGTWRADCGDNHTVVVDAAVAPTCTATGLTEGSHCSACGKVIVAQQTVAAKGHTEVIDAAKAPTCTETGLTEGKHCSVCNTVTVAQNVVPATDHSWSVTYNFAADGSSCTATRVCGNDASHNMTATAEITSAPSGDPEKAPTLDTMGWTTYTATFKDSDWAETQTKDVRDIPVRPVVAMVGDARYATLQEAIDALGGNGGTIRLLMDTTEEIVVENPEKPIVILRNSITVDNGADTAAAVKVLKVSNEEKYAIKENYDAYVIGAKEKFFFEAANVHMGNSLTMMFGFVEGDLAGTNYKIKIEQGTNAPKWIAEAELGINGGYTFVSYNGIVAKQMTEVVTVTLCNSDGEPISNPWVDSMRGYAMRIYNKPKNDAQKALAVALLNYGSEAQKFFTHNKENLANRYLTDTEATVGEAEFETKWDGENPTDEHGDYFGETNMNLGNSLSYWISINGLTTDMRASVSFKNHYGQNIVTDPNELLVPKTKTENEKVYIFFALEDMVVADAWQEITITVYNGEDVYTVCEDSIAAYLYRFSQRAEETKIEQSVIKFANAAYAYLHG